MDIQTLPKAQRKVYAVLMNGGRYSIADICVRTHQSDPRSAIRDLRKRGIDIADEWRKTADGDRYKVYFLTLKNDLE